MGNWEKAGIIATVVSAAAAVFALWPAPKPPIPPLGPNTIKLVDASYVSKDTPRKRSSIWPHVYDVCENKVACDFHCDNRHSDGDPDKGTDKHCVINYSCSNTAAVNINLDVREDEHGTHRISCPQPK